MTPRTPPCPAPAGAGPHNAQQGIQDAPGRDEDGPCHLGIDPGLDGAVAFLMPGGRGLAEVVPTVRGEKGRRAFDRPRMVRLLEGAGITFAAIEKVDAAPMRGRRQGTTSMFRFGSGFGLWLGILEALAIPYVEVPPRAWKKAILSGTARDKAAAVDYCRRFHADVALVPFGRRVEHHGIADAVCLAEYARRFHAVEQLLASAPGPRPARPPEEP